jgi:hypothetical protein
MWYTVITLHPSMSVQLTSYSLCLNVFARKPNLEKMYIYSNKFFHNFHLSESSFTCPGLRESVLARKLILIYFSRTIGTKHDRDVNTVVVNNLHHFTYILSFYHFLHIFYHFTYIFIQFTSFYIYFSQTMIEMWLQ